MKNILMTVAIVLAAAAAQAGDNYFYWMLDETPSSSAEGYNPNPSYLDYTVKVKDGDNYLTFANPGADGATAVGAMQDFTYISAFAGDPASASFIIELWNDAPINNQPAYSATITGELIANYSAGSTEHMKAPLLIQASQFTAVPEPTSGMMLLVGAMLLGLKRKKLA